MIAVQERSDESCDVMGAWILGGSLARELEILGEKNDIERET